MKTERKEWTPKAIIIAMILAVGMAAAMAYLAMFAGQTIAAAIPAAVLAALITLGRASKLELNIMATGASAGESLAAGATFTIPALLFLGIWNHIDFWTTAAVVLCGGLLGSLFMIPLRRVYVSPPVGSSLREELKFPEGTATAKVIETVAGGSLKTMLDIIWGLTIGAVVKLLLNGLILLKDEVWMAWQLGKSSFGIGVTTSPALVGVGYIIGIRGSLMILGGGVLSWLVAIPIYTYFNPGEGAALDIANGVWTSQIRYLGIGTMLVGALYNIWTTRGKMWESLKSLGKLMQSKAGKDVPIEDRDISGRTLITIVVVCAALMLAFYLWQTPVAYIGVIAWVLMLIAAFLFMAVSVYMVGLIGSSSNPVSGMVIATVLVSGALMVLFGLTGTSGMFTTIIIAGVVCSAAATGGEIAQTLKTGELLKAEPRAMQRIQIICVVVSAAVLPLIMQLLHQAYGIGKGLKAPQAVLVKSVVEMMFDPHKAIPWVMLGCGAGVGLAILAANKIAALYFKKIAAKKVEARQERKLDISVMAVAVGIYLPISLSTPLIIGALIRHLRKNRTGEEEGSDSGTLFGSGLIAGEALMAIVVAIPMLVTQGAWGGWKIASSPALALAALAAVAFFLYRSAKK